MKPELQLDERVPACAVVRLHGHMVAGSVDNLAERIEARRTPEWRSLVVDLAGVDALSSSGIRVLLKLEQWTRRCGLWFEVRNPSPEAARICKLTGLTSLLEEVSREVGRPFELTFPAERDVVVAQLDELEAELQQRHCADDVVLRVRLVLEELLLNVATHARPPSGRVEVRLAEMGPLTVVRIVDDGPAFDPFSAELEVHSDDLALRRIGGLGLPLVRQSIDWARYQRSQNRNIVEAGFRSAP